MQRSWQVLLLFLILVGQGCSSSNDVVGHGPFQKRKYRPGWSLDFAGPRQHPVIAEVGTPPSVENDPIRPSQPSPVLDISFDSASTEVTASSLSASLIEPPILTQQGTRTSSPLPITAELTVPITSASRYAPERTDSGEPRRWNRMALVSGGFLLLAVLVAALGGGGIIGYIFSFSVITGLIGLILAIKHNERGKGIAIAAIAFPLAVLALVIAALNSAW